MAPTPNYRIIVIRTNSGDDDAPEGRTGFNRILDFLSMKNSELNRISRLGCLTTGTYARMSEVELPDHRNQPCDVLGEKLGLKSLRRLLTDKTAHRVHMLFLSADSDANLHDVSLLVRDKTIDDFIAAAPGHRGPALVRESDSAGGRFVAYLCGDAQTGQAG